MSTGCKNVVGAIQACNQDDVIVITNSGKLVRMQVSEINILSRNTKGIILIRMKKAEKVISLQRIVL